jgi:proton glutamate symport protein
MAGNIPPRFTDGCRCFRIPLEGAAILLGIDQILDMGRTGVNVIGNCVASVVVARWEGVFDDTRMEQAA